jgi:hypothetical protein
MTMTTTELNKVTDVASVLDALERWIVQKPGLEFANYGNQTAYRSEYASIQRDKKRALAALELARACTPRSECLSEAFRAFSGRLEWDGSRLTYTTGQYWPTEYRKAASSVLESYVALAHQADAAESPKTFTYLTMQDVIDANKSIGHHWFDRETLRFFNTRIESSLIAGEYFITSERVDDRDRRRYSLRRAKPDGTVETIGAFQAYASKSEALNAARAMVART